MATHFKTTLAATAVGFASTLGTVPAARSGSTPPEVGNVVSILGKNIAACTPFFGSASLRAIVDGEARTYDGIESKFAELSNIWKSFSGGQSVVEYNHAAYMQIIGMGASAIPILIRKLHEGQGDWIVALKYITGEKVTTPEMKGNFKAIREAWLKWGQDNGFWPKL